jgi:hypothetical protein
VLSQSGPSTLTHDATHSHDDGLGPIGFCAANVALGARYLALVSARFETDVPLGPGQHLLTDYTAQDSMLGQFGMGWSGGNVAIYVEVRAENGARVSAGFEVVIGALVLPVPDQGKPAGEFPMNFAMSGGGNRYLARAKYTHPQDGPLESDAVTNMRLPSNHHVNYLLTFQVRRR